MGRKQFGKGENAGYQHFLLFPKCFQKLSSSVVIKRLCGKELNGFFCINLVKALEGNKFAPKKDICTGKGIWHCGIREKNASHKHFLLFPRFLKLFSSGLSEVDPTMFSEAFFIRLVKSGNSSEKRVRRKNPPGVFITMVKELSDSHTDQPIIN